MSGLLILLHGHGDQGTDMADMASALDPEGRFVHVTPDAPLRAEGGGRSWFNTGSRGPDPLTLSGSVAWLDEHIGEHLAEQVGERGSDRLDEVVVVGYSQGGAMALAWSLVGTTDTRPASMMCLSGYLPDLEGLPVRWDSLAGIPVLLQHGRHDDVVPLDFGADSAATLAHHGTEVTWQEHDGGHRPSERALAQARVWLEQHSTGRTVGAQAP